MAITKNFVTDYSADNTGVASVTTKLYSNLKGDMQGQDVNLTFPAGSYNIATFGGSGGSWINGAKDLNVTATGATLFGAGGVFLSTGHLADIGIDATSQTPAGFSTPGGKSARIQTVNIGATSVTLTSTGLPAGGGSAGAGHISRFTVGNWMLVTGWAIQGSFQVGYSFPPNFQFAEYVKITGIVGDTISFTPALQNFYSANWPEINRGDEFHVEAAGPATIFALAPGYGGTTTFTDGSYDNANLINCYRENFYMTGGTSVTLPIYPSVNKFYRATNHTATTALTEVDKISGAVEIIGGTYSSLKVQSPAANTALFSGVTVGNFNGTPKNAVIDGCNIAGGITIGPISYGVGEKLVVSNSTIGGTLGGGLTDDGPTHQGWQSILRVSGGVITVPLCYAQYFNRVCAPDAAGRNRVAWTGSGGGIRAWNPLSVTSDTWGAGDYQTSTVAVTSTNGSNTITVGGNLFTSGDIYKVIRVPFAKTVNSNPTANFWTIITGVSAYNSGAGTQDITIYEAASNSQSAVSQTLEWQTCNEYVTIKQASETLPGSGLYGTDLRVAAAPARWVYFSNNTTTDPEIIDQQNPLAQGRPFRSYSKRTYTGNGTNILTAGDIVSITINVTKAYTGVQGTLRAAFGRFNNAQCLTSGNTVLSTFGIATDLLVTGSRIYTIGNTVGKQPNDILTLNGSPVGGGVITAPMSIRGSAWAITLISSVGTLVDITGESPTVWPEFTVEIITDPGPLEVPAAVAPLRLRLRAA